MPKLIAFHLLLQESEWLQLIGPSQGMICPKGLKSSLFCLCNCGLFLHLCCTYLRLAKCVNRGCSPTAQGSTAL